MPHQINVIKTIKLFDPKITNINLSEFEPNTENVQELLEALKRNPYIQAIYGIDLKKWMVKNFNLFTDIILKEIPNILSISDFSYENENDNYRLLIGTSDEYVSYVDSMVNFFHNTDFTASNSPSENEDEDETNPFNAPDPENEGENETAIDENSKVGPKAFYQARELFWQSFIKKLENGELNEIDLTAQLFYMSTEQLDSLKEALTKVKNIIKKINLSNNPINAENFCTYFDIKFTILESINLKNLPIGFYLNDQEMVKKFTQCYEIIFNWITSHLKELIIFKCKIFEELLENYKKLYAAIFLKLFDENCFLETLSIEGAPLNDKSATFLISYINKTRTLTLLNIQGLYKISDENLAKILSVLKTCKRINSLQVFITGEKAALQLCLLLKDRRSLEHLTLTLTTHNNHRTSKDLERFHNLTSSIFAGLISAKNNLKSLSLHECKISFTDAKGYTSTVVSKFLQFLENNTQLETLSLREVNLSAEDYVKLLQKLVKTKIAFFYINQFSTDDWQEKNHEEFLKVLVNLFMHNSSLKTFTSIYDVGEDIPNIKQKLASIHQALTLNTNVTYIVFTQSHEHVFSDNEGPGSDSDNEDKTSQTSDTGFLDWLNDDLGDRLERIASRNAQIESDLLALNFTSDPQKQIMVTNYIKRGFFVPNNSTSSIRGLFSLQKTDPTVINMTNFYLRLQLACLTTTFPSPDKAILDEFLKITSPSTSDLEKQENAFKLILKTILCLNNERGEEDKEARDHLQEAFAFSPSICEYYLHSCKSITSSDLWDKLSKLITPILAQKDNVLNKKSDEQSQNILELSL